MALLTAKIPNTMIGMRFDQCLAKIFPDYSRNKLQTWLKEGRVSANTTICKGKDKVSGGEVVVLNFVAEKVLEYKAEAIPLDIIFEDNSLLIVNKPAGLVVHPAAGNWQGTLLNALINHDESLKTLPRAGIVHRLDKYTSGLLMVAKTLQSYNNLVAQLKNRTVIREYLALVRGWMTAGGTVNKPIERHPVERKRNAVRDDGKPAVTHYRIEHRYKQHSLIRIKLETGRTHQIRVHMAYIQHPVMGDSIYGGRFQLPANCSVDLEQALRALNGQALHATKLGLQHPVTKKYCAWEQALPDDINKLLKALECFN